MPTDQPDPVPTSTPPKPDRIPALFHAAALVFFALAWLLFLLLWDRTESGLFAVCLLIGAAIVATARVAAAFLPVLAERWRKRTLVSGLALIISLVLLSSVGVYAIFLGSYQAWERFNWNVMAPTNEEFKMEYQGAEHRLLRRLPEFAKDIPRAELGMTNFRWSAGLNLAPSGPPCVGFYWSINIFFAFFVGILLIWAAYQSLLSDKPGPLPPGVYWRNHVRPALILVLATVVPVFAYGFILLVIAINSSGTSGTSVTTNSDLAAVADRLEKWAAENGYVSGDYSAWTLSVVPQGEELAKVQIRHLWQPNVFDRWDLTFAGMQSKAPDLALQLIGSVRSKETVVVINAKFRGGSDTRASVDRTIDSLRHALDETVK